MKVTGIVSEIKHHGSDYKVKIGNMQIFRINDRVDACDALDSVMQLCVSMSYSRYLSRVYENGGLRVWVFEIDIRNEEPDRPLYNQNQPIEGGIMQ